MNSMTQTERILVVKLAQKLLQATIDFSFYKRKSGAGEINPAGHPDYAALARQIDPLTARLGKATAPEETPDVDLEKLLQEVLTASSTLLQS
jgi:hypothetical protein